MATTTAPKNQSPRTAAEIAEVFDASLEAAKRLHSTATDLLIELITSRYPDATAVSAEFPWYLDGDVNANDEWRVCHIQLPGYDRVDREYDGGTSSGDHDGPDEFGEFTADEMRLMDRLAKTARKDPRWRHFREMHDELASMRLPIA